MRWFWALHFPGRPENQRTDSRGITCVRVDLAVLRGEREPEPELTLFAV